MDGGSFGRLSRQTVVLPDQGEIEPVRLIRTSPATDALDRIHEEGRKTDRTGRSGGPRGS